LLPYILSENYICILYLPSVVGWVVGRASGISPVKTEWWGTGVVICLHMAQLMPLPLTVSCFSKIQIGFTFLVSAHPGSPRQRAVKRVYICILALNAQPKEPAPASCIGTFVPNIQNCHVAK